MRRFLLALCALALPVAASAEIISGGVYEDPTALALRQGFAPAAGVTVTLYRDGGRRVATSTTDASGQYAFLVGPGEYWVAVDSRTLRRGEGTWAEQTFGPAGALCAQPEGEPRTNYFAGACIGGRTVDVPDDPSSLATSEHVARVKAGDEVPAVDFGFSFNLVSNTVETKTQGSLRQFLDNANRIPGSNRMRFVPVRRAPEQRETNFGVPPRWWAIVLTSPLPELTDDETAIDGTSYSFVSPDSPIDANPGRIAERPTIRASDRYAGRQDRSELELVTTGESGIVCSGRCTVRALATHGAAVAIVLRNDARLEDVIVGARPDGHELPQRGVVGVQIERGTTVAFDLYVTEQSRAGIAVATAEARLDGQRLDVSRCGEREAGGGIVLFSDGSSIRGSNINENRGAGVIIGSSDGRQPAHANTIDGSTISSNWAGIILSPAASRNAITRNDILWNRVGGVVLSPYEQNVPQENRISANRYNENGNRPIVLDLTAPANMLAEGKQTCARAEGAPNRGMTAPDIESVRHVREGEIDRILIRGRACPGETVELYQSFVTSSVRETKTDESPAIRNEKTENRETLTTEGRAFGLPSIGEFNYVGATATGPDGKFEAVFPILVSDTPMERPQETDDDEVSIWHDEVLRRGEIRDRAFSAIAIDPAGNTSEMSTRRGID